MHNSNEADTTDSYKDTYTRQVMGPLYGLLSWSEFDGICEHIRSDQSTTAWYAYEIGDPLPQHACSSHDLNEFILTLNKIIHKEYDRDHCGIAFVDSISNPALLKVFNPKLLKSICNIYGTSPLHGWVVSRQKPVSLPETVTKNTSPLKSHDTMPNAAKTLDARRTGCPLPIINTCRALQNLKSGQLLEIMTIEPGAVKDVSIICGRTGDKLDSTYQTHNGYSIFVEKA